MKAKTRRLRHPVDLGAPDDRARVGTGFAYGLAFSLAMWIIVAGVVVLLIR